MRFVAVVFRCRGLFVHLILTGRLIRQRLTGGVPRDFYGISIALAIHSLDQSLFPPLIPYGATGGSVKWSVERFFDRPLQLLSQLMRFDSNRGSKRLVALLRAGFLLVIGVREIVRYTANIISLPPPDVETTPQNRIKRCDRTPLRFTHFPLKTTLNKDNKN